MGAPLRLNALAGDYRFHHMTALSEAVGVACALGYVCEWLRQAFQPRPLVYDPVGFDYLLGTAGQPGQPVPGPAGASARKAPNATRQPDYLVAAQDPSTQAMRVLLVECKGTSSGRGRAIEQLGSAMHQLEGVIFGGTPTSWAVERHAYSAVVSKTGGDVEIYGVDPPGRVALGVSRGVAGAVPRRLRVATTPETSSPRTQRRWPVARCRVWRIGAWRGPGSRRRPSTGAYVRRPPDQVDTGTSSAQLQRSRCRRASRSASSPLRCGRSLPPPS